MTSDGADGLFLAIISGDIEPEDALREIVRRLHTTTEPDVDVISDVGVGPLESLFHRGYEERLWTRLEELARLDKRFRRALQQVWAYDSPMFERRQALLEELGEFWPVNVSFIVYPEDFAVPPVLDYRALHLEGSVPGGQLPRVLREIADRYERDGENGNSELMWDSNLSDVVRPWMKARAALKRALHALDVSSDATARARVFDEVDNCRNAEGAAWSALRAAAIGPRPSDT